jgi:hypothetical protein
LEEGKEATEEDAGEGSGGGMRTVTLDGGDLDGSRVGRVAKVNSRKSRGGMTLGMATNGARRPRRVAGR